MKQRDFAVLILLAASSAAADTPVPSASASPAPAAPAAPPAHGGGLGRHSARPVRVAPSGSPGPVVAADPYNHTQVQVVSVDVARGTMTFVDTEGETNEWTFEPVGLARDPVLKAGERVTIVWKADASGTPTGKIFGVVAFKRPAPASGGSNMAAHGRPQRRAVSPLPGSPAPAIAASPSPSPSAPPSRPR